MNLSYLVFLACPIGMGVMMWMMMRGNGQQTTPVAPSAADPATLQQQLNSLERQQLAIIEQMQQLREDDLANVTPTTSSPPVTDALDGRINARAQPSVQTSSTAQSSN